MQAQRLRTFLNKPEEGSTRLQLAHDGIAGLSPMSDWSREELAASVDDVLSAIISEGQEYADSQEGNPKTVTFALRWLGENGQALKSARHRVKPEKVEEDEEIESEARAGRGGATDVWVTALIKALLAKDTALNEAYKTSLTASKETIEMLQAQSANAFALMETMRAERASQFAEPVELTPEQREESRLRGMAWAKLVEILPKVGEFGMSVAAQHLLPEAPDVDASPTNGHSA